MPIQWFPGHMHQARLEMQAILPKVDLVIEVLDARIPYSSENPLLAELRGDKPCLKVLAKSDLADEAMTETWLSHFEQTVGVRAHAVTTDDVPTIRKLKQIAIRMLPHRRGQKINAMIVGIPNVGKSTIINFLAGRKIAKTGNTPAVTKHQQRVTIGDGFALLDTPGMLWPNVHNVNSGFRLALLGSVKETAMDYAEVGFFAAGFLGAHYPDRLAERYNLESIPTTELEIIEAIGRKRGCLGKMNLVDIDRASRILVTEVRSGGLGLLTLETPETMEEEKVKTAAAIAAKAEATKAKDAQRKKRFRDKQRAQRKSREME
ncbi:Ribosome biogenesis GTPase A [Rosistilla oblonga]|uniref:Ribosome biogenesis GTPase A n=1 Tax=Rosistilla oblonga TaxID=2527990 RepID=A0A518J0L1_9BACT|nr:ribosome biogenesis GTPase YlqF [Rosistilla oblonga]QDV12967.1 Ribosome biogenesis GTPase A [Rosistilla oblonga]QDV58868.1 Ribosome biogenesis GTPase A [Rosistilla oblonga]